MKKLFASATVLVMLLASLTACSDRGKDLTSEPSETSQETSAMEETSQDEGGSTTYTMSEAAANNANIDQEAIKLVQFEQPTDSDKIAVVKTSKGKIRIRLFPEYAPKAVENFTTLVEEGFYNGKPFHHIIPDYLIQTGAANSNGTGSKSVIKDAEGNEAPFQDEFSMDLWHFRGTVTCANPGTPDSNGSQFMIIQAKDILKNSPEKLKEAQWPAKVIEKYEEVGGAPHLDWKHTIFGMVIDGMDIVDEITQVETDDSGTPKEPVTIESISIEAFEGAASNDASASEASGEETASSQAK